MGCSSIHTSGLDLDALRRGLLPQLLEQLRLLRHLQRIHLLRNLSDLLLLLPEPSESQRENTDGGVSQVCSML